MEPIFYMLLLVVLIITVGYATYVYQSRKEQKKLVAVDPVFNLPPVTITIPMPTVKAPRLNAHPSAQNGAARPTVNSVPVQKAARPVAPPVRGASSQSFAKPYGTTTTRGNSHTDDGPDLLTTLVVAQSFTDYSSPSVDSTPSRSYSDDSCSTRSYSDSSSSNDYSSSDSSSSSSSSCD